MHRHGVQVRPRQAAHSVSFVGVTKVTSVVIGVTSVLTFFYLRLDLLKTVNTWCNNS